MTSTTRKTSTAADLRDEPELTPWQFRVGLARDRIAWDISCVAQRLQMFSQWVGGVLPSTFAEDTQRNYDWGHKIGLGNGIVAAMTEWDCYDGSQEPHCDGAPAAWVYCLAREHGLDGAAIVQRVADAARRRRGEEPAR